MGSGVPKNKAVDTPPVVKEKKKLIFKKVCKNLISEILIPEIFNSKRYGIVLARKHSTI